MIINRIWSMSNFETFKIKPITKLIEKYLDAGIWIDPFVRNSIFKDKMSFTNDLNKEITASHNIEALDFLKLFDDNSIDGILFDPPYSPRQIQECYNGIGKKVFQRDIQASFYSDKKNEVSRILKTNGICISFGWNSLGIGKTRNFDIIEILLVPHGGAKNDTIVTVERKK
jgi:hypothetical protein